jgi:hypothetical protein
MRTGFVRGGTVVTLAVVLGLLVAATGLFVVLYLNEKDGAVRASGDVARTESAIDGRGHRLASIKSAVDTLDAEKSRLDSDNRELHACADPSSDLVEAARARDEAGVKKASSEVLRNCAAR